MTHSSTPYPAQHLSGHIRIEGGQFIDEHGRTLHPRGLNCSGASKLPSHPNGSSHVEEGFFDHRSVSFIGRPFPVADIPEHLARLREWGMTLVRLAVTWEALEHAGPGEYDEGYIEYLVGLIEQMPRYGIKCFIDPHQDTWSRFSGGSGAPGWTFEAAGMEIRHFKETGAAFVHNVNHVAGEVMPMLWPTNYTKLATATMFTLFWGSEMFAPARKLEGESMQSFLQRHYCGAFAHLASRIKHLPAVLGMEVMNEPHAGYIGLKSLNVWDHNTDLVFGDAPSALDSFALGDGIPRTVGVWDKSWPFPTRQVRTRTLNTERLRAWAEGVDCPWRVEGVWGKTAEGEIIAKDLGYFTQDPATGKAVCFDQDFYLPFVQRYQRAIQEVWPEAMIIMGPVPNEAPPTWLEEDSAKSKARNLVYGPHWYDLQSIFSKSFGFMTADVPLLSRGVRNIFRSLYFGEEGAIRNYAKQLGRIREEGKALLGGDVPCIIGECGIPMDLDHRKAFKDGDWSRHESFMNAVISGLERNLLTFTLWNYNPFNDQEYGDHWNGEDFSVYSLSHAGLEPTSAKDPVIACPDRLYSGGRVLSSILRPYPAKVAGILEEVHFSPHRREFRMQLQPRPCHHGPGEGGPMCETDIFLPDYHYHGRELKVEATSGQWEYLSALQTLIWKCPGHRPSHSTPLVESSTLTIHTY